MYSEDELKKLGMQIPNVGFESSIESFEELDREEKPKKDGIVFYGDSDIGYWRRGDQFTKDFSHLPAINRGFGGARIWETLIYFKRIIMPHAPSVILYNCGDNDVANLKETSGDNIRIGFDLFLKAVQGNLPNIKKVICLSIHPAPRRNDFDLWGLQNEGNLIIEEICGRYPFAIYEDYNHLLFDNANLINETCFLEDRLHYTEEFYSNLARHIEPIIQKSYEG